MASLGGKINRDYAIEFVRQLLGRPGASEGEILELAQEAFQKVELEGVSVDLRVRPTGEDARLRRVLQLLLRENNTTEGER